MSLIISKHGVKILKIFIVCLTCLLSLSHGNNENLRQLQSINLARQEAIQNTCRLFPSNYSNLGQIPPQILDHILIDNKHKLLYCYVPKIACTNWKRIFMILTGKWNSTDPLSIPSHVPHKWGMFSKLSEQNKTDRDFMLRNYHKMIVTRSPFERILSAYRNKLEGNTKTLKTFQNWVGRHIIRMFRRNPSKESLAKGNDVTFEEFAKLLTERPEELKINVTNEHWHPITELCHPCLINYTLVGKFETIMDDARLTLHTINASHIQFPKLSRPSATPSLLTQYFSQLDQPRIRKLYEIYERDFMIFNYTVGNIV